jgi:4-amino-4-deoxy-L-arabinose transferase-like glycosyltransferase
MSVSLTVPMGPASSTPLPGPARRAWRSADVRWAAGLAGLALLLRVAFVLAVERDGFPLNDTLFYNNVAAALAEGRGFTAFDGVPTAQWPPAFPFLLSIVYRITGPEALAGELANAVLGALCVAALYALAHRVFGRREAIVAAAALALLPGQILWTDVLLAETLYTLVLTLFFLLVAYLPPRPWTVVALGLAIGLATLTRGEGLLLIPAVLAIWWPELPRRRLLLNGAALAMVAVLTVLPWTIRNTVAMDAFVPLSTNSSTTLWSGHNPGATGSQNYAPPELLAGIPSEGKEREIEEGRLLRREALEYMVGHPARELELIPLKLVNLMRGDSWALEWVNDDRGQARPLSDKWASVLRVAADFGWYGLLAATLAALVVLWRELWRNRVTRGVIALFGGSLVLFGFVYYGNYRYRVPLEPLMLLIAAPLAVRVWGAREGLRAR